MEELDERSDVFALGAILCEILTGKPPYAARSARPAGPGGAGPARRRALERLASQRRGRGDREGPLPALPHRPVPGTGPRDAGVLAADGVSAHWRRSRSVRSGRRWKRSRSGRGRRPDGRRKPASVSVPPGSGRSKTAFGAIAAVILAAVLLGGGAFLWHGEKRRGERGEDRGGGSEDPRRGDGSHGPRATVGGGEGQGRERRDLARPGEADEETRLQAEAVLTEIAAASRRGEARRGTREERGPAFAERLDEIRPAKRPHLGPRASRRPHTCGVRQSTWMALSADGSLGERCGRPDGARRSSCVSTRGPDR